MNVNTLVKRFVQDSFTIDIYLTLATEEVFGGHVDISDDQGQKCRIVLAGLVDDETAAIRALESKCMDWIAAWTDRAHSGQSVFPRP